MSINDWLIKRYPANSLTREGYLIAGLPIVDIRSEEGEIVVTLKGGSVRRYSPGERVIAEKIGDERED